ncbi:queuosine-tRNA galactosyltransferase isoform X5 [Macaca fascicularis]|uniref:queuosine-tRNA galactosyltransferase isoform X5 n=1 Tax=Macaca fascicularis TaxID=9541 RepID=UPI003D15B38A
MQAHVSIILPVHNAEPWLDECLRSVLQQDFEGTMELSVFNDASKDKSGAIIEKWRVKLEDSGVHVIIGGHDSLSPRGVGYSKNQAVAQSSGSYLCFLDSDDVMMPQRVRLQHQAAVQHPSSIIGCRVRRDPPNSTERYTRWINQLTPEQLLTQGVPEDLLFFYEHLRKGGGVVRVDQSLLLYRYHPRAATHSVLETTIWTHRVRFLEEQALPRWAAFTIWNAGKQGRRLYRSLTAASQRKVVAFCDFCACPQVVAFCDFCACPQVVAFCDFCACPQVVAFCDVDENKIRKGFYCHEDSQERPKPRIPILHFRAARPPFVICVKLVDTGHPQPLALEEAPQWPPGARRDGTELYLLLPPGPHRGRLRGQPEVVALAGGPGLPSLQLTDPRQRLPEATCSLHPQCIPGQQELRELQA